MNNTSNFINTRLTLCSKYFPISISINREINLHFIPLSHTQRGLIVNLSCYSINKKITCFQCQAILGNAIDYRPLIFLKQFSRLLKFSTAVPHQNIEIDMFYVQFKGIGVTQPWKGKITLQGSKSSEKAQKRFFDA